MSIIRANCRDRLSSEDVDFIQSVLGSDEGDRNVLVDLLTDADSRDSILDESKLVSAIQDRAEWLTISSQLYFYLLVRHCFQARSITDRDVADYVADLLAKFASAKRVASPLPDADHVFDRVCDLLAALQDQNAEGRFLIRTHIANYSLFLSGIFPERIARRKERRGTPGLDFYEQLGQANYQEASTLHLAGEYDLHEVFEQLAHWFREIRVSLNDLADRFLSVGTSDADILPAQ